MARAVRCPTRSRIYGSSCTQNHQRGLLAKREVSIYAISLARCTAREYTIRSARCPLVSAWLLGLDLHNHGRPGVASDDGLPQSMPGYVNTLYRFSTICGALPLVLGPLLLASIAITGADWLAVAGSLFYFILDLACLVLGTGALVWALAANRRLKALRPRGIWGLARLPTLLLGLNFLAIDLWLYIALSSREAIG